MAGRWKVEWLVLTEGGERIVPGLKFLSEIESSPRLQLLRILEAVCTVGPDQWRDQGMHCAMHSACSHLHEARDRQDQTLYRLYLRWQRDCQRVVILDGGRKANDTILPTDFYKRIAALGHEAEVDPSPFATPDDMVQIALHLAARAAAAEKRAAAAEQDVDDLLRS